MNGQKVVKVFCHEEAAKQDFDKLNDQLFRDAREGKPLCQTSSCRSWAILEICFTSHCICRWSADHLERSDSEPFDSEPRHVRNHRRSLSISAVASYLGMCKQFTANVSQVSQQMNAVAMAVAGAGRIFDLLDQKPESDEGTVTLTRCRGGKRHNRPLRRAHGQVGVAAPEGRRHDGVPAAAGRRAVL